MSDKITCPNCGHHFDVEKALSGQLEAHFKAEYERKLSEQAKKFQQDRDAQHERMRQEQLELEKRREEFEKARERENEIFQEKLKKKLDERLEQESQRIEKQKQEAYEEQLKALQRENEERKRQNQELRKSEVELLKRERELKEKEEELKLNVEKQMLEKQKEIEENVRKKEREANELREREFQKQLDDQKKLIEEMKRKAEQGSMQLQGEVQELALEELLAATYPFDEISEVPKGIRGADCIQTVINSRQQACGSIVYESKRTKTFSNDWIDKLKQDMVTVKADIAVIVTQVLPSDMQGFGEKDGVWICGYHEVKSVSAALRAALERVQNVKASQHNKGDKMEMLYNYLTSNEFVQNINRIVENYEGQRLQLDREKRAMQKLWKEREKQIELVQNNISSLFGSIKGIAGNAIGTASSLELPE
jgi:hypothetical protein